MGRCLHDVVERKRRLAAAAVPAVTSARRSEPGAGGAGVELLLATFFAALLQLVNFSTNELTFVCRRKATRPAAHGREGEHHLQRLLPQHTLLVAVLHHLRLKPAAQHSATAAITGDSAMSGGGCMYLYLLLEWRSRSAYLRAAINEGNY